jgi:hypothetical protein
LTPGIPVGRCALVGGDPVEDVKHLRGRAGPGVMQQGPAVGVDVMQLAHRRYVVAPLSCVLFL